MVSATKSCPKCGKTSDAGSLFCQHCDASLGDDLFQVSASPKSAAAEKKKAKPKPEVPTSAPMQSSGLELDFEDYEAPEAAPAQSESKSGAPSSPKVQPGALGGGVRHISESSGARRKKGGGGSKAGFLILAAAVAVGAWYMLQSDSSGTEGGAPSSASSSSATGPGGPTAGKGAPAGVSAGGAPASGGAAGGSGAAAEPAPGLKVKGGAPVISVKRGQGKMTEEEAVEQVNQLLGQDVNGTLQAKAAQQNSNRAAVTELPPSASIEEEIAALESRVNSDSSQSQDVATYLEEMAKQSKSDGSAELAAMDKLLDDTQKEAPEETAEARAALAAFSDNPEQFISDLEEQVKEMPDNENLKVSLADAKVNLSPDEAYKEIASIEGAKADHVKGKALFEMGKVSEGLKSLQSAASSSSDADAHLDQMKMLSRVGRCFEAKESAQKLLEDGGYTYVYDWMLYQSLCLMEQDKAWKMGESMLVQKSVRPEVKRRITGLMAMIAYWFGYEKAGHSYCKTFRRAKPSEQWAYGIRLRCALANGKLGKERRVYVGPKDQGTSLAIKSAWALHKKMPLPKDFDRLESWRPSALLVRLIANRNLRYESNDVIVQGRGALFSPRWTGEWDVPLTAIEMRQLAKLGNRKDAKFRVAVSHVLAGRYSDFKESQEELPSGMTRLLRPVISWRLGMYLEDVSKQAQPFRATPIGAFLIAQTIGDQTKSVELLKELLSDQQLAPYAYRSLKKKKIDVDKWEAANKEVWMDHPAFLQGAAY